MTSPVKDGQVTSVPGGGKMIHYCDDEKLSIPEQAEMLVHDLDVIVKQLTELVGPTETFQGIKPVLSDLISLSQEEQIEKLTARNLELEEEKEKLLERLSNQ